GLPVPTETRYDARRRRGRAPQVVSRFPAAHALGHLQHHPAADAKIRIPGRSIEPAQPTSCRTGQRQLNSHRETSLSLGVVATTSTKRYKAGLTTFKSLFDFPVAESGEGI